MRVFCNGSFDPQTLVVLEAAFDEAWLTLKTIGNDTVKPDELARCVLRVAMEGERDPGRLHVRRCWARSRDPLAAGRLSTVATAGLEAGPLVAMAFKRSRRAGLAAEELSGVLALQTARKSKTGWCAVQLEPARP